MKLIYVADVREAATGKRSVVESQVFELLNYLSSTGRIEEIILLAGVRPNKSGREIIRAKVDDHIKILYFDCYPQYPFICRLTIGSIVKKLSNIPNTDSYIFHARNELICYYTYEALKKMGEVKPRIVADIRGAVYEEIAEYYKGNFFLKALKLLHFAKALKSLKNIGSITTVSESLKKYIISKKYTDAGKITVIPCLAGALFFYNENYRTKLRKSLGLEEDDLLIIHATGGNEAWQNTDRALKELCSNNLSKGIKILNLSKSFLEHSSIINAFVSYEEVPGYLSSADIAVIWRECSFTNKVASPVKFSEYVCCGLPIITNDSIEAIAEYIKQTRNGIVLDSLEEIDYDHLMRLKLLDRDKIAIDGRKNFGNEAICGKYLFLYRKILNPVISPFQVKAV
jgi:hypothetical protein